MATDRILELRPANNSSSAIAVSIANARSMLLEAETAVSNAKQERDEGLLDAAPAALAASERKLKAAQDAAMETRERVEAVLGQLEARLVAAKRSETLAEVEAAKLEAEAAGRDLVALLVEVRELVAPILRRAEQQDTRLGDALRQHHRLAVAAGKLYPAVVLDPPAPTGNDAFEWQEDVVRMMQPPPPPLVLLPPDDRELEMAERRRQLAEHDLGLPPGGLLGSGRANLRSVS